ncbi:hypothetical protein ABT186_17325 [Streptomyces sp. NPDC001634]|uniref:hypothetical protein n=1 Tax=Streptomyces sp. NPDC001634 TaxID=3154390 RepID=UPI003332A2C6
MTTRERGAAAAVRRGARRTAAAAAAITLSAAAGVFALIGTMQESPAGGWRVRVQDVTGQVDETPAQGSYATVGIRSGGLATSGTTARRWRRGGYSRTPRRRDGAPSGARG